MKSTFILYDQSSSVVMSTLRGVLMVIALFSSLLGFSQVSINTDGSAPDASAMLEVKSSSRGLLLPRMNLAQRPLVPAAGLVLYQLDSSPGIYYYDGAAWQKMSLAAYDFWNPNGPDIYFSSGRVGIGTTSPDNNGLNVMNYVSGRGAVRGADQNGSTIYAEGYLGVLSPALLGIPLSVTNIGVLGIKVANGSNGAAVYGWNNDDNSSNYGSIFFADGANITNGSNYGVFSTARNALNNYAGYFKGDGTGGQVNNFGIYSEAAGANQNFAGFFKGRVSVEGNSGTSAGNDSTGHLFTATVNHTRTVDTYAVQGISEPQPGFGYGVYGRGAYRGIYGYGNGQDYSSRVIGVQGYATATTGGGERIGVYGSASGGTSNWGSYFVGSNYMSGDLRIGTTTEATGYTLSVNGKIACEEVLVQDMASWPDYVFKSDYELMSLEDLEQSIRENGHLPGLPSAREIESGGLHLGNMQKQVVEKVEELTLYTIEQGKMLRELKKELETLKAENASLRKAVRK